MKSIIFCLGFSVALAEQRCQSSSLLQASTQHVFGTPVSLHFPTLSNFSENSFAELFPTAKLINLDKLAAAGVSAASPLVSDVPWGQKMINPAHYVASDGTMRVLGRVTQSTRCCAGDPIPAKMCSNNPPPDTTEVTDALVSCPIDKADNECKVVGQFADPHTFRVNGDPFALVVEGAWGWCVPKIVNLTSFQVVSLTLPGMSDCEKNWVPFVYEDELFVSYWLKPIHRVLRCSISSGSCQSAFNSSATFSDEGLPADRIMEEQEVPYAGSSSLKEIHGGSAYAQLNKNYLVAAAHRFDLKLQLGGIRRYFHAFYAIRRKPPFEVVANTRWFQMPVSDTEEVAEWSLIQYAGGLMRQGDDFILSYGVGDCVARAVKIPVAHVAASLGL